MFELRPYRRNGDMQVYNPFRAMEELERRFFEPFGNLFRGGALADFKTDITDCGDHYRMETDLPGFAKEDIHLDLSGDTLTIRAERHSEHEQEDKKEQYLRVERSYGEYARAFDISAVDAEAIRAKYENGVLTLDMPKKQKKLPETRQLEIE